MGGWLLFALGSLVLWASLAEAQPALRYVGLFAIGAGIALPYALAPRIALAALPEAQSGKGSGLVNSCSFLGGTVGVTCGGVVSAFAGFPWRGRIAGAFRTARRGACVAGAGVSDCR